ncbi:MAG: NAD(P)-dependent oxidoreductase [Geminicoccaceae bacterium]|nr:NAD(P)-dependent oxidoreductase [Geminicoccaceae bacterium]MDW8370100.1 NAD(P)-dependent oxidoreductase [Geminicoccaceae bacterium]
MERETIGFLGLGAAGAPIARRLAAAGWPLVLLERDRAAAEALAGAGSIAIARDLAELERRVGIVLTCLPSEKAVEKVAGALARPGLLLFDLSTVRPATARRLHASLSGRGIRHVECPILPRLHEGPPSDLFLLVSGEPADIERVRPLLPVIGQEHRLVGGPGAASRIVCVHNALALVELAAIAEAMALLAADGGDLDAFLAVVAAGGGWAASPLFRAEAPRMREARPAPGTTLRIAAKDAALAASMAEEAGLDLPLFRRTAELLRAALAEGLGELDMAAVARAIERETGIAIARAAA